jgi:hypothetical protein
MTVNDKGMPPMVPAVPHHVPQQPMNQLSSTPTKAPVRVDKHIQGAPVEPPPRGAVFNPVTQAEHEVPIEKPPKRQEPDGSQIANIKGQDADSKQVFKLYFSLFRPILIFLWQIIGYMNYPIC